MIQRRKLLKVSLSGLSLSAIGLHTRLSFAQTSYPDKPIKLIVPFAAGGPTDMVGRLMAHGMEKELGQNIIVENKPGGGSNIGSEFVARAKPDGYTLLLGTIANATNMSIYNNLNYNTERDLVAITQFMSSPSVLVVHPSLPINNLNALIAYAKANPGKLSFASSGAGGSPHLAGEMLKLRAGIDLLHVPYKGASPALNDVLGGNVSMGFMTAAGALPSINAGKLRPIAVAGLQRLPQLPDVPTMAEAGIADFEVSSWNGLFAPAGTPPAILQKLAGAALKVITQPEMQKTFESHASLGVGGSPEQFKQYVHAEIVKWGKVAEAGNIKLN
jgi:tripartite-type tricarboxylate transporter receptor subunit TctC